MIDILTDESLVLLVNVQEKGGTLRCNFLYCHHNAPSPILVRGGGKEFLIDISDFLRPTPADYSGDITVNVVN